MSYQTLALVGAVGGAGTTRTAVECGGLLASAGFDVAVLDAAFATQGLADYVAGGLPTDLTAVVTEDVPLEDALVPIASDLAGELVAAPARAPFERVARAKTAGAADRFERAVAAAGFSTDVVLVDTPPVAANQAVAAVSACERVTLVAPATRRGADGVARMHGVLEDVGAPPDTVVTTRGGDDEVLPEAAARLPAVDPRRAADCPSCVQDGSPLAAPVAALVAATLGIEIEVETGEADGIERFLPGEE